MLLLGGGGREHAIGWKLAQSPLLEHLVACPGNPGLATLGDTVSDVDATDPEAVVALAQGRGIDLVVVGPEAPLAAGVADALIEAAIPVFGPVREAARLESSKTFAKEIMTAAGVPTAAAAVFEDADAAKAFLASDDGPFVIKADGLAAGKGVLVTSNRPQAEAWVDECLDGRFGEAGTSILVEEYMPGNEVSVFFVCANGEAVGLGAARDFKRLLDDDQGPNTGGMGSYSPVADIPNDLQEWTKANVVLPTLSELGRRGIPYTGFLYVGLMLTTSGPRVVEFNARLGDPETEVLLPRMRSDLLGLLDAAANQQINDDGITWDPLSTVSVVLAADGYPTSPRKGDAITMDDSDTADAVVFHAGTAVSTDGLVTAGGRVLNVVGIGPDLASARESAYAKAATIAFDGKQYRTDIARSAVTQPSNQPQE